jgi:hypothetical protein
MLDPATIPPANETTSPAPAPTRADLLGEIRLALDAGVTPDELIAAIARRRTPMAARRTCPECGATMTRTARGVRCTSCGVTAAA